MNTSGKIMSIDFDTYSEITKENEKEYQDFLNRNKCVKDTTRRKKVFEENILGTKKEVFLSDSLNQKKEEKQRINNEKLQEKLKKDEDNLYVIPLIWLENFLPRFELMYGAFNYSKEGLSNKEKYQELYNYYQNECHIENIEDLQKKSFKTMKDAIKIGKRK